MGDKGGVSVQESTVYMNNASVSPVKWPVCPLLFFPVYCMFVRSCVGVRILALLYVGVPRSHRRLPSSDPSGASDHHRPDARPASRPAQPRPRHHADPHASDSSDPELHPRAGSQSAPGACAARTRVWNHLHALRVSLHTHALHIGIPD